MCSDRFLDKAHFSVKPAKAVLSDIFWLLLDFAIFVIFFILIPKFVYQRNFKRV